MKIVIPGGTGQVGAMLARAYLDRGDDVVVITRGGKSLARTVAWDGKTVGAWAREIDGCDAVVNLAGRTVNCRYTEENLKQMMDSRVDSTVAVGQAIAQAKYPPKVWLQMSTATIYTHRFDAPNDEVSGTIGGQEPDAPAYWGRSVDIGKAWEAAQQRIATPRTRQVAMRTAMVMSPDAGGVYSVLRNMTLARLGGPIAGGRQFVSWIHGKDFVNAVDYLIRQEDIEGAVNVTAPHPLPQREFMATLRRSLGVSIGLPAMAWMAEIGAFVLRTDTELLLKSRQVVPKRLLDHGFAFAFPSWDRACADLAGKKSSLRSRTRDERFI